MSSIETDNWLTVCNAGSTCTEGNENANELLGLRISFENCCAAGIGFENVFAVLWQSSIGILMCSVNVLQGLFFCTIGFGITDFHTEFTTNISNNIDR